MTEPTPENNNEEIPSVPAALGINCHKCGVSNQRRNRFCRSCGIALKRSEINSDDNENVIYQIIGFFTALVLLICLYGYSELFNPSFESSLLVDCIMAVLVLGFSIANRMELAKLFNPQYVNASRALILSLIMVGFAIVVHMLANAINRQLFGTSIAETGVYHQTQWPLLFSILFIGVYPAIFEELAFRGFLFNQLLRFTNPRSVIIITGILFAFMHFALIGLLWYIPIGLFWGYLRFRYRTIWYGMLCHFVYNTTIVVMEFMDV